MITHDKKQLTTKQDIYIICLNPHCPQSKQRCLNGTNIRAHPSQCSKYYYPTQTIIEKHTQLSKSADYPNDSVGISVNKKIQKYSGSSFFQAVLNQFRQKIDKKISQFAMKFLDIYPIDCLENKFMQMYSLQKLSTALKQNASITYINKIINNSFTQSKYTQLLLLNQKYDKMSQSLDNICEQVKNSLGSIIDKVGENLSIKKTLPDYSEPHIIYGLIKSKYIGSTKILCENGVVTFPKIDNIASFLPWVYCEKAFSTGIHQLKIHCLKFPSVKNCGFSVIEEHDIDTYPYHFFKSLYGIEGRGFTLVQGSQIAHIISETSTIFLTINLGSRPHATICDPENRSKYQCQLKQNRSYRLALYGCGWAIRIIELY